MQGARRMKLANYFLYKAHIVALAISVCSMPLMTYTVATDTQKDQDDTHTSATPSLRRINQIIITGNVHVPESAILKYIPYRVGEIFDARKTREAIRTIYFGLKRFRKIDIYSQDIGSNLVNIHFKLEEKPIIKDVIFTGNTHMSEKELRKAIDIAEIPALDAPELKMLAQKIKKEYIEKGYHLTTIETTFDVDEHNKATATFIINENKKSVVRQIRFKGNHYLSSKELRSIMITREEWLLSFLDKAGTYHPDRIEADKYFISRYYQNRGFLHAKVTHVTSDMNERTKAMTMTYHIEEGDRYTIKDISVPGNDILTEEQLKARLPIRPGQYYSPDRIADTLKILERIWGNHGYIFAHIDPSIEPDDETKTVNLTFYSELGNKITLNKITIKGNKKTRDKVIRRKMTLKEGEQLTQTDMDVSKRNVESLGYFDAREGVNWKLTRLSDNMADLDLMLKEAKTGNFNVQAGFGGADLSSPADGLTVKGNFSDSNLFGSGIFIDTQASWAKKEQTASLRIAQPWLMDKPISGAFDLYHRRPSYDQLRNVATVNGKLTGGSATLGFMTRGSYAWLNDTQILFIAGVDNMKYENRPVAQIPGAIAGENEAFQCILNKEFDPGTFAWLANIIEQNHLNHPVHTSRGLKWTIQTKLAFPTFNDTIGFFKWTSELHWYTPFINEYDLVFHIHAYAGIAQPWKHKTVPFPEMFHVGGQYSVRGYLFGQISPRFAGDPIGASKALFWNAELIFPITPDMNMKGVVFYDGGAGFDNPYLNECVDRLKLPHSVQSNNFDYRHAVGVGIRMLQPMPIKIDWGFKLDPRKGESASEVHFGMSTTF